MSDRSLTLLALHLEDATVQIGPKRLGRSRAKGDEGESITGETSEADASADETDGEGSASPIAILVAVVVVLAAIAAILGRVRGPTTEENIELEEESADD